MPRRLLTGALGCLAAGAALLTGTGHAQAAASRARVASVPQLPAASRVTGRVPATRRIALTLSLQSRDPLAMQRLATEVSTPGSPVYRDYLSVGEFAARFGASPAHIRAVRAALRADGLAVAPVAANHLTLSVTGTAAQVQRAFATRLAAVRLADGRRAFAQRTTPTLPATLAPDVDTVVGLNTLSRPTSGVLPEARHAIPAVTPGAGADVAAGGPQPCRAALKTAADPGYPAYTANVIQDAYGFTGLYAAGSQGGGQTIAVFELEKVRHADLTKYAACYGVHTKISYVNVGHPEYTGNDGESALDTEQILALAPRAHIIVYQTEDTDEASVLDYAKIVSQDRAKTISVSWGSCERKITANGSDFSVVRAEDKLFQEAALQGQSILSASGDTGSAGCNRDTGTNELAVQDPAAQPFATGVGGTSLYTEVNNQLGLWNPAVATDPLLEGVWNDGEQKVPGGGREPEASTGGISALWTMPNYQNGAAAGLGLHNAYSSGGPCHSNRDCREVPDVSAAGDPALGYVVYLTADGEHVWTAVGGTSAAAPLWAALTADMDALPACRGASLGFENPSLYTLAATQPGDLRDITGASPISGRASNDATGSNHGLFPVTTGYDMTTGLGVPNAAALGAGMCALRAPVYNVTLPAPALHDAVVRSHFHLTLSGTDSGGLRLRYRAHGLPRGLAISRAGVISGRPRQTGHFTVTVTAVDHATNRASVRFRLTVLSAPAAVSKATLDGVARRHPQLTLTVTRGRPAPDLRSVTIRLPTGLTIGRHLGGIRITHGRGRVRFAAHRIPGGITLRFVRPQSSVRIILRRPTLFASGALAKLARTHHGAKVVIRVAAVDHRRRATHRSVRLRLAH